MPSTDCADCGYDKAFHDDPKFFLPCNGFVATSTDCADCGYDKAFHDDPKFFLPCNGFVATST